MLFNCFAFLVAACALASRHRWKNRCKTAEYFADSLATSVIEGIQLMESVHGQNKATTARAK